MLSAGLFGSFLCRMLQSVLVREWVPAAGCRYEAHLLKAPQNEGSQRPVILIFIRRIHGTGLWYSAQHIGLCITAFLIRGISNIPGNNVLVVGWTHTGGGGEFRPGTISQGIISPGENFATLEIPKAPSKHVSRKMSLNFRKMI